MAVYFLDQGSVRPSVESKFLGRMTGEAAYLAIHSITAL